ncbi:MAG: spondin domain-containing protein, partial [Gammaproteobacteria bacterium]
MPLTAMAADQATFTVTIKNVATDKTLRLPDGGTTGAPIAPGAYAIVEDGAMLFDRDKPAGTAGLQSLSEDGDAEALIASLKVMKGIREVGMFVPGQPFDVTAKPGERLVFASMFVQSNDLFFAPDPKGIDLFDTAKMPRSGEVAGDVMLWDAGTEVNEAPGAGPNQAPRQTAANTGPDENGVV